MSAGQAFPSETFPFRSGVGAGEVEFPKQRFCPELSGVGGRLFGELFVAAEVYDHVRPEFREGEGYRAAYALSAARDERRFAFKVE